MPSFSFVLTEKCDWKCKYCYFPNLSEQKEPKLEIFQKHLPYIKKTIDKLGDLVVNIDIQGGEIGTIPIEILEYFCEIIDRKIAFSTNGLFLYKKYHLRLKQYIGLVMLHLYNFQQDSINEFTLSEFAGDSEREYLLQDIPISRGIVHDNIDEIYNVIQANPHIIFDYVELEFDIKEPRRANILMYHELLERIGDLPNLTANAKVILYRRLSEDDNHRDRCRKFNHSILIDLVNENICLCQRQLNVSVPLTQDNLFHRLRNFPKDIFAEDHCDSCTRLYTGKFYGNVIERALLTRNKL